MVTRLSRQNNGVWANADIGLADKGGGVWQMLTLDDKGGGGLDPPFLAHITCGQSLIVGYFFFFNLTAHAVTCSGKIYV